MARRLVIDIFCEDIGHETFLRHLIKALAHSMGEQCTGPIETAVDRTLYPDVLIGCPDPHVEVWCTADPEAFQALFSVTVPHPPSGKGRLVYKQWLTTALEQAGVTVLTDPMDISLDLLPVMDLVKACRNDDSLDHLVRDLKAWLHRNR